jgi:hypothetical protein
MWWSKLTAAGFGQLSKTTRDMGCFFTGKNAFRTD